MITQALNEVRTCRAHSQRESPPSTYKESSLEVSACLCTDLFVWLLPQLRMLFFAPQTTAGTQPVYQLTLRPSPGMRIQMQKDIARHAALHTSLTVLARAILQVQDRRGHPRQVGHAWCPRHLVPRDFGEVRRHRVRSKHLSLALFFESRIDSMINRHCMHAVPQSLGYQILMPHEKMLFISIKSWDQRSCMFPYAHVCF